MAARSRGSRLRSPLPPPGLSTVQQAWAELAVGLGPVTGPCPHVADQVEQAIAIGREPTHRRGPPIAVRLQVLVRELALPGGGHPPPPGRGHLAPAKVAPPAHPGPPAPTGLAGPLLARPAGLGGHGGPVDLDHRMVGPLVDRAGWPLGGAQSAPAPRSTPGRATQVD